MGDEVATDTSGVGYDSYVTLTDIEGIITVDVPAAWDDTDLTSGWIDAGESYYVALSAAEDIGGWLDGWETSGVFFGASTDLVVFETVSSILDSHDFSASCQYDGRVDYSDALYVGEYDVWTGCGGGDTLLIDLAAETPASNVLMLIQVIVVTDADLEALDFILNSFVVDEVTLAALSGGATTTGSGINDLANLWDGECFNLAGSALEALQFGIDVDVVSCDAPHVGEIFGNYFIPDAESTAYPGVDTVEEIAAQNCAVEFENYVGSTYAESSLDYWFYWPGQADWDNGLGFVMCALVDYGGGDLVGSAWQSGW